MVEPVAPTATAPPAAPLIPSVQHPVVAAQRADSYKGYYNQRYYNYQYGIHTTATQTPHEFSQTADVEQQQRPIYIGVAAIAIFFGMFMIFSAFSVPKLDPDLRAQIQESPAKEIRAIVFCDECEGKLEAMGFIVVASYPAEGAVLIAGKGNDILDLEGEDWITRLGLPD